MYVLLKVTSYGPYIAEIHMEIAAAINVTQHSSLDMALERCVTTAILPTYTVAAKTTARKHSPYTL